VVTPGTDAGVPAAPLYTQYFKGRDEFRVHVVRGEVIDVQQKKARHTDEGVEVNQTVRNLANGWVFCREGVVAPDIVVDAAKGAVRTLGLDFGAVDIKCNRQGTRCAVLEVNTAPGLEGTSLDLYKNAIRRMVWG
jgi:glutathione synthase/RimK-type ligase-like ATP-grasp enzyme